MESDLKETSHIIIKSNYFVSHVWNNIALSRAEKSCDTTVGADGEYGQCEQKNCA